MLVRNQLDNSVEPPPMVSDEGLVRKELFVDSIMCEMDSDDVRRGSYDPQGKQPGSKRAAAQAWSNLVPGVTTCLEASFVAFLIFLVAMQMYGPLSIILLVSFILRAIKITDEQQLKEE